MSTQQDALRKAREALMEAYFGVGNWPPKANSAIALIDAAIASQPAEAPAGQGEPVYQRRSSELKLWADVSKDEHDYILQKYGQDRVRILYAALAQPVQAPAVPTGYVIVPIEPTEDMVIHGFESRPDPIFQPEHWDEYEQMTGCQQAAFRAKLCWAAMIAAAPPSPAAAPADCRMVPLVTLQTIYAAMNHMGDVLNNMDAVEEDDEEITAPAFDAMRDLLAAASTAQPKQESDDQEKTA